jgi:hypothetical protein
VLLAHAEAMSALEIEVQFRRFPGGDPILINLDTVGRKLQLVIPCSQHKCGWSIWGNSVSLDRPIVRRMLAYHAWDR